MLPTSFISRAKVNLNIPRTIHQIWIQGVEQVPPRYQEYAATWKSVNPEWEYQLWDQNALRSVIQNSQPNLWNAFEAQPEYAARADIGRYILLKEFGGIYCDIDTCCVRSVDSLIGAEAGLHVQLAGWWTPRFGKKGPPWKQFANSIIGSSRGHPLWTTVLQRIEQRHGPDIPLVYRTGPEFLLPFIRTHAANAPQDLSFMTPGIVTSFYLPRGYMHWYGYSKPWVRILDFNDTGRRHFYRFLLDTLRPTKLWRMVRGDYISEPRVRP